MCSRSGPPSGSKTASALDWAPSTLAPRSTISARSSMRAALASSAATSAIAVARCMAASRWVGLLPGVGDVEDRARAGAPARRRES